ncbi:MAG: type I-E CRISPR-associated endonuclease Cas1 [candidate division Zixibacteria bacterium]|nr:type I-E CRISPR-associated endonuclease Cas1 [candidate division Zixibacteria bacterium]
MRTLYDLPRFSDRWSFLYLEMCKIDKDSEGLLMHDARGHVPIPIDQLSLLMLGPGTSITHPAIYALAQNNCMIAWTAQDGVRLYAHSMGGTFSATRLLEQARLASIPDLRLGIARRMYQFRFAEKLQAAATMEELRGLEGRRVRDAYRLLAAEYDLKWEGRNYDQSSWNKADPLNRALSTANACLYGICHAAIVSSGFSPAIGFIHTGKMLSFVYDIADLYKIDLSVRTAFRTVAEHPKNLERAVREACRSDFHLFGIMQRIIPDIMEVLNVSDTLGKIDGEFEGKAVSMADRAEDGSVSGESFESDSAGTLEED